VKINIKLTNFTKKGLFHLKLLAMKNKSTWFFSVFFLGVFVGGGAIWMWLICYPNCCGAGSCGLPTDTTGVSRLSVENARRYFHNYSDTNTEQIGTLTAFAINADQYAAMQILARDTTVHGFRLYMGRDDKGKPVRIVVGTGSPEKSNVILVTDDAGSGPCPYCCDEESEIMKR
jgi:hypothetical protein